MTDKERYEDALRRFEASRAKKRAIVDRMEREMQEKYEKETGLKCNYVFSL